MFLSLDFSITSPTISNARVKGFSKDGDFQLYASLWQGKCIGELEIRLVCWEVDSALLDLSSGRDSMAKTVMGV